MENTQDLISYKSRTADSFADKLTNHQVGDRANFWTQYGKMLKMDMELLLHEFIITNGETKEQVDNIKKGADMLLKFYKACYNLEQNKKKLDAIKTTQALQGDKKD